MSDLFAGLLNPTIEGDFMSDNGGPPENGPDDTPPDPPEPPIAGWVCEVCGVDVPSRRGRKPKHVRCQDHPVSPTEDTDSPKRTSAGRGPRAMASDSKKQARLDAITNDLQEGLGELTGSIVMVAPVTAVTMTMTGPKACASIVRLASDYPKFLDGLEKAAKFTPWVSVAKFVFGLFLAIMVDMDRADPYGIAGRWLGVAAAADEIEWQPRAERKKVVDETGQGWVIPQPAKPPVFARA